MLLAMKHKARSNLNNEENDFMLDTSYEEETMEELTATVMLMGAFKERENRYLEDICDLEEKLSSHDQIIYKMGQSLQIIHMLGKTPNKVYDPFLKAGLGYKNPERLKKETLEDAEESQLKMRNKMVQINYAKLNTLYETFVPHQDFSVEQTYFSIPSTLIMVLSVESSNSVRRPNSKDTKSKNRVLKNTNAKSLIAHVRKMSCSDSIYSNKCKTKNSNVCKLNASVLSTKTVNDVNDGSNIVCVSYGKDVFLLSHEKCVARYALSRSSSVKRALFTTPVAAKSKNLGTTSIVVKSRLSVAKTQHQQIGSLKWVAKLSTLLSAFVLCDAVCFGNDHFAVITGYGDYVQGNITICYVYYVEGLGYNLFLVGQFCDEDLELAFRSNTFYIRNLKGDDLITGSCDSDMYTISISEMAASSPVCLMSRATSTKSWLWHRWLSHLNFTCEQGKSKKASLPPKLVPSTESKLELLYVDLCRPMRVASIIGKKYILMIDDDYSWKQGDKTKNKDKGKSPVVTITGFRDLNVEFEKCTNNSSNGVNAASSSVSTAGQNSINNTNDFSAAGPLNAAMPNLEDLSYSNDADNVARANEQEKIIVVVAAGVGGVGCGGGGNGGVVVASGGEWWG
nr:hypothetical protein [Tanacetum cinerariifolium]